MEDILSRFIHIGDKIFEKLDSENLVKCRTVAKSWKIFIGNGKNLPICIMNTFTNIEKEKLWNTYKKCPTEKVARIAIDVEKVYKASKNPPDREFFRKGKPYYLPSLPEDPMHVAIREGYFDVFQLISNYTKEKNPINHNGDTALHVAAKKGDLEMCKMIMEHIDDKNPKKRPLYNGTTPLHEAANAGHLQTCKLIMKYLDNKNPCNNFGETPLHEAARGGQFETCQLFIQNVSNKNPKDKYGKTPLHEAARRGQFETCQLFIENVSNKNPKDKYGKTPLH